MAANDPYLPDHATVADNGDTTFDGSGSSTNKAIISELYGNFDATITIEGSTDGGSTWTELTQLADADGNNTFTGNWHTQYNRIMVEANVRRVKIADAGSGGECGVSGDERGS